MFLNNGGGLLSLQNTLQWLIYCMNDIIFIDLQNILCVPWNYIVILFGIIYWILQTVLHATYIRLQP